MPRRAAGVGGGLDDGIGGGADVGAAARGGEAEGRRGNGDNAGKEGNGGMLTFLSADAAAASLMVSVMTWTDARSRGVVNVRAYQNDKNNAGRGTCTHIEERAQHLVAHRNHTSPSLRNTRVTNSERRKRTKLAETSLSRYMSLEGKNNNS